MHYKLPACLRTNLQQRLALKSRQGKQLQISDRGNYGWFNFVGIFHQIAQLCSLGFLAPNFLTTLNLLDNFLTAQSIGMGEFWGEQCTPLFSPHLQHRCQLTHSLIVNLNKQRVMQSDMFVCSWVARKQWSRRTSACSWSMAIRICWTMESFSCSHNLTRCVISVTLTPMPTLELRHHRCTWMSVSVHWRALSPSTSLHWTPPTSYPRSGAHRVNWQTLSQAGRL